MPISMNDTFYMFPINEVGEEKEMKGHKLPSEVTALDFNLYYIVISDVRLLIDGITGMAVWGDYNDSDMTDSSIVPWFKTVFTGSAFDQLKTIHRNAISNGIVLQHCVDPVKYTFEKQSSCITRKTPRSQEGSVIDNANKCSLTDHFKQILINKDFGNQTAGSNALLINPLHYVIPEGRKVIEEDLSEMGVVILAEIPSKSVFNIPLTKRGITDILNVYRIGRYIIAYYVPENNILIFGDIQGCNEFGWFRKVAKHIKKTALKIKKSAAIEEDFEVTVGCDPEFELYNSNNKLLVGTDLNADGRLQKKIGADGAGRQLELRPEPSTDPREVCDDLAQLFSAVSHLRVCSKGDNQPLGGHIHFGVASDKFAVTIKMTPVLVELLDFFIGRHTTKMNGKARGSYGRLGDARQQPWGFEYRVAPAAVFTTKRMAYITMKLGKKLIERIIKEDISAEYPLKLVDLLPYLTREEAEYFLNFPDEFKTIKATDIVQYWTEVKQKPIEIKFYDKWASNIKEDYKNYLKDTIIDAPTVLCLYGIRGKNYAGLDAFGNSVPHPRGVHCNEGIAIGLPISCRELGQNIGEISAEIKRKIGGINGSALERTTAMLFPDELIGSEVEANIKQLEEEA